MAGRTKPSKRKQKPQARFAYTWLDVLNANPDAPMPIEHRTHHLNMMWCALASIEAAPKPTDNDWRLCSDAVNILEMMVNEGICEDRSGLIADAINALALAYKRKLQTGAAIRLDGRGIFTVRSVLEDYAAALDEISERTAKLMHYKTERRVRGILAGKTRPHDVELIAG